DGKLDYGSVRGPDLHAFPTRRSSDLAKKALKRLLLLASTPERDRVGSEGSPQPFFAFRLHQFISGAGIVYTTLDAPRERPVELECRQFLHGDQPRGLSLANVSWRRRTYRSH